MLNYSAHFLIGMQNFTGEEKGEQPFTTVEYKTLQDLIKETLVSSRVLLHLAILHVAVMW